MHQSATESMYAGSGAFTGNNKRARQGGREANTIQQKRWDQERTYTTYILNLREVLGLKQLLKENDVGALGRGLACVTANTASVPSSTET